MAGAKKHMERSHRSHNNKVDYSQFDRNAKMRAYRKDNNSIFSKLKSMFMRKRGDK